MVRVCMAGNPLVTYEPYLSALEIRSLYIERYINSSVVLLWCDIFQGRSVSVGVTLKKSVVGSVTVFIPVH